MRILTRYILTSFIKNYLISLGVLIGLYVVLDMVFNADDFAVARDAQGARSAGALAVAGNMAGYYFFQSFRIFSQLSGVIPVVAAAFTLLRLSRFNELTAMMAAGIPLRRVAVPVILAASVVNVILLPINTELVIPAIIPQLTRQRSETGDTRGKGYAIQNMQYQSGDASGLLLAGRYHAPTPTQNAYMEQADLIEIDADTSPVALLHADRADYVPDRGVWKLTNGVRVTGLRINERRSKPQPVAELQSNITPEEIALFRSGDFVELLSTMRINDLLARSQVYGTNDLLRVKHARVAQILLNIIMVVIASACVLIREPTQIKFAVVKCLVIVGLCMATIFLCQIFAAYPPNTGWAADNWPALMAWLPIFIFGTTAWVLFEKVKT